MILQLCKREKMVLIKIVHTFILSLLLLSCVQEGAKKDKDEDDDLDRNGSTREGPQDPVPGLIDQDNDGHSDLHDDCNPRDPRAWKAHSYQFADKDSDGTALSAN